MIKRYVKYEYHSRVLKVLQELLHMLWRDTTEPTQERNHTSAPNVTRASQTQVIWKNMREPSLLSKEKPIKGTKCYMSFSLSFALKTHNRTHTGEKTYKQVTRDSKTQVTWNHMRGPTLRKNHSSVQTVTRASPYHLLWRHTRRPTLERNHTSAPNVTRVSKTKVTWKHMREPKLRKTTHGCKVL